MNFSCNNCQHRYNIADDKVRGRTVKVRCRHCQQLITVEGPPADVPEERTAMMSIEQVEQLRKQGAAPQPPPVDSSPREWLAMIKGQQSGPFDQRGLEDLVRTGGASARTYFWRNGMPEWKRGSDVPELASLFASAPAPVPPPTAPPVAGGGSLDELFSDADLPVAEPVPTGKKTEKPAEDPFAALGEIDPAMLPPPGEATAFFIAQAGVNRRNPPWKIAAFVGGAVGAVAGILFLLSSLEVVPLTIKKVDAAGNEVEQSVFSAEGMSGLGERLLGRGPRNNAPKAAGKTGNAVAVKRSDSEPAPDPGTNRPKVEAPAHQASSDELAALYGDASKKSIGPRVRKGAEQKATDTSAGGPSDESIARVVASNQTAFQFCIEQELRKNPNLRVPKFYLVATVASSGVVKKAGIDRKDVDGSNLGECLKSRAKRMVFAQFSGDEVDVEIPLLVGVAM